MAKKTQIEKFKEMASEIGADADQAEFDEALKKVAKANPQQAEAFGKRDPNAKFVPPKKPRKS